MQRHAVRHTASAVAQPRRCVPMDRPRRRACTRAPGPWGHNSPACRHAGIDVPDDMCDPVRPCTARTAARARAHAVAGQPSAAAAATVGPHLSFPRSSAGGATVAATCVAAAAAAAATAQRAGERLGACVRLG
eukprot:365136-Chlamydomonas_euryale.AAC.4